MTKANGAVCVVGSLNIDLTTRVARHPRPGETVHGNTLTRSPGGKGANQVLAAARAGAKTSLIGRVGADPNGEAYRQGLEQYGVDVGAIGTTEGVPSGHALILVDEDGENTITVIPGANAEMKIFDVDRHIPVIADASVLLLQFEVPMPVVRHAAAMAHGHGVTVVLNPSPFSVPDADLLRNVDVLVVNEHEAATLGETGKSTVVTSGAGGAEWDGARVTPPPVSVVDTTGAGDAFAGALSAGLARGETRAAALKAACEAGSLACEYPGAQDWTF